jgi:ABC-2 type transport system permease protein
MSRLRHVIKKEFIQIRRNPVMIRLVMVAPVFQLIMFGYAATNDVRNVPVAVYDGDRSADSRAVVQEIGASVYFRLVAAPNDPRALEQMLLRGRAQIGVVIPPNFHRDAMRGGGAHIGVLVDGTDANTAGVATAYLTGILRERGLRMSIAQARRSGSFGASLPAVVQEPRVWYNEELKSVNFMVPGVFGLILLVLTVNLGSLSIVRERETGTLEQLMVTPLRSRELILGKMLPFVIMVMLDASFIFLLARGWFGVPFRGSVFILFGMGLIFLLNTLGLGLLISAVSRTQQEAQIVAFLLIMPSVLLSGFMFPIQNMPVSIQYLTYLIPYRYFLQIARGLFLKGVGVEVLWPQMLALLGFGVATFVAGVAAFRKHL